MAKKVQFIVEGLYESGDWLHVVQVGTKEEADSSIARHLKLDKTLPYKSMFDDYRVVKETVKRKILA